MTPEEKDQIIPSLYSSPRLIELLVRLLPHANNREIVSVYFASSPKKGPKSTQTSVLWLGCAKSYEYRIPDYYLCDIQNPSDGLYSGNLYNLGLQHINWATKIEVLSGNNVVIRQIESPHRVLAACDTVPAAGWVNGGEPPDWHPRDPYQITFDGAHCVLRVYPAVVVNPAPGNGSGSPPPPYSGGNEDLSS